jgi:hypothetical protein
MRDSDVDDEDAAVPQDGRLGGPAVSSSGPVDNPQPGPASSRAGGDASGSAASAPDLLDRGIAAAVVDRERQAAAREAFARLGSQSRNAFRRRHRIADVDAPWPNAALWELLGPPAPAVEVEQ